MQQVQPALLRVKPVPWVTCLHLPGNVEGQMENLSVKDEPKEEPREKQPVYEEMTYNESEILKAYEQLIAEDPR